MNTHFDLHRPYLVIPKLVEQPTWGGQYIVKTKGWENRGKLSELKIGQSYELFSGSNLSSLESSEDPQFHGELTDRDAVGAQTAPPESISLQSLIDQSPAETLGEDFIAQGRSVILIKFTQALGNSFQTHVISDQPDDYWQPKPESWYYFESGLITLGAKPGVDWQSYESVCKAIHDETVAISARVKSGSLSFGDAQLLIKSQLSKHDPWQFVNTVAVEKDQLIDLSCGGLHHSWEEHPARAPLGNVLYELQGEALDRVATMRSFDKGKMEPDGSIRKLQIADYFKLIDRTPETNNPTTHIREPEPIEQTSGYTHERLLKTPYYSLNKLTLNQSGVVFREQPPQFKHLFVQSGKIQVVAGEAAISVTTGHSCFIPAGANEYLVKNLSEISEVLMSY